MSYNMSKGMDQQTQKNLADFLTGVEEEKGQPDTNSRISDPKTAMALTLLRMLEEDGVKPAGFAADTIEKLSWSIRGMSRTEAVRALMRVPGVTPGGPSESYSYRPDEEE